MVYEVGETVVYPHHGAATIQKISERTVRGQTRTYLTLRVSGGNLTIQVPAENVERVGMRDVIEEDRISDIVGVLESAQGPESDNWSRRSKVNLEKIATGDTSQVAEVVRDLARRERDQALSSGEKRILTQARQVLASELALARGISEDDAQARIDYVLARAFGDDMPTIELAGGPIPEGTSGAEEYA